MFSLHQLRCFLATYEHGSLTAAAAELGYAQPSISEQIRSLEKSVGTPLFRRVGRGVVPTTIADTLRPHAERTLAAADDTWRAVRSVTSLETGTIRFGMFGTARLVRRGRAGRRRAGAVPGRPGRADRPELHGGAGRAAAGPARGGHDRGAAGSPARA